ncbi:hypothetical protein DUI87_13284 [Hirundo rustica rustica]|uniref:Uncharacterized protein n=1 Tax=Hirundo rustica rustica TaxID=333673 RepID=A0A3M0KBA5_HIRRU|nr:hypothetical protein DUI87_13284 [Hirundo rustica rustica]
MKEDLQGVVYQPGSELQLCRHHFTDVEQERYRAFDIYGQIHELAHAFQVVLDIQAGIWSEIYFTDEGDDHICCHPGISLLPQAQRQIGTAYSDIPSVCAKVNNAMEFLPQGKATVELPIGLLPVELQCRGGHHYGSARKAVESPTLGLFERCVDVTLGDMV